MLSFSKDKDFPIKRECYLLYALGEEIQPVASRHGTDDGDQAYNQQDPMGAMYESEGGLGIFKGPFAKNFVKQKRLQYEEDQAEDKPHQDHGMHPPVAVVQEAVPGVKFEDHVQAAETGNHGCELGDVCKPALYLFEAVQLFFFGFHSLHGRKNHQGDHGHAPDPDDDTKDMENSGDSDFHKASVLMNILMEAKLVKRKREGGI